MRATVPASMAIPPKAGQGVLRPSRPRGGVLIRRNRARSVIPAASCKAQRADPAEVSGAVRDRHGHDGAAASAARSGAGSDLTGLGILHANGTEGRRINRPFADAAGCQGGVTGDGGGSAGQGA